MPWPRSTAPAASPTCEPAGLHVHLGSQIRDVGTYVEVAAWLASFIDQNGLGQLPVLDLGGGLAVAYTDADRAPDVRAARRGDRDRARRGSWSPAACRCRS